MLPSDSCRVAGPVAEVLQSARDLAEAVAAGYLDLVLKAESAHQRAFVPVRDGPGYMLEPKQVELLLDTAERTAAFLRGKMACAEADIRALRSWRHCLAGYRLPGDAAARFVDRQG